tara:strand:+ start:32 stop:316 length:285 start_codon:yes stop_codon:yes gene_type:complete
MNNKKTLAKILLTSAVLTGCNSLEKNNDVLIGNYTFEREAIQYADSLYKGENKKPTNKEYLEMAENVDDNKNLHISKKEIDNYFSEIIGALSSK